MRAAGAVLATLATLTLVATGVVPAAAQAPGAVSSDVAPGTTALFRMDEAPGATVMTDSGPGHHDAPIDPTGVQTGVVQEGATALQLGTPSARAVPGLARAHHPGARPHRPRAG